VSGYLTRRNVTFGLAILIGLGAFAGSARELWRIAETAQYGLPVGLVAALDGLAVVCVIVLSSRRDWQALATLVAATFLSIGLQVLAVPRDLVVEGVTRAVPADRYVSAVLVHALVPLASFMAVHLATRLDRPDQTGAGKPRPKPAPKPVTPAAPAPAAAEVTSTPVRPAKPAARVSLEELVPVAELAASNLERKGRDLSRRTLQAEMKEAGRPVGAARADELVKLLKAGPVVDGRHAPALELVEANQ
jgi:hypothetical protein